MFKLDFVLDCDEWLIQVDVWQGVPQCNNTMEVEVFY